MIRCSNCQGIFHAHDAQDKLCPTCFKERMRNEDLICRACGHHAHFFKLVKSTCYSLFWECNKCGSNDVIDPDCAPTSDEEEYDVV